MRGLDPKEVQILEDAAIVLSPEALAMDPDDDEYFSPEEQAAADRMKARGLVTEADDEFLDITTRGRVALMCHHALKALPT